MYGIYVFRCVKDHMLLTNIEYDADVITAYAQTRVFKYADKVQLFFTCTVQLCFKNDGGCDNFTVSNITDILQAALYVFDFIFEKFQNLNTSVYRHPQGKSKYGTFFILLITSSLGGATHNGR